MDLYPVNCQPNELKCDAPMSFIIQMMCMVVAQKLRCLKDWGFRLQHIEMVYWQPLKTVSILCTIVGYTMTVSMSLRWAYRWVSTERQRFLVLVNQQSNSWIVASIKTRSICSLNRYHGKRHTPCPVIEMSVRGASTISGLASWIITGMCNGI